RPLLAGGTSHAGTESLCPPGIGVGASEAKPAERPRMPKGGKEQANQVPDPPPRQPMQQLPASHPLTNPPLIASHWVVTLLNARACPASDILALYGRRWDIELDIRELKRSHLPEVLRARCSSRPRRRSTPATT